MCQCKLLIVVHFYMIFINMQHLMKLFVYFVKLLTHCIKNYKHYFIIINNYCFMLLVTVLATQF